ncbi:MBL fold metallo-hydrolase [Vagococcus elongatus]|uniref:Metallo-beta-lactamase domain-containing protein n=1 Tax=Vagococcus elongatus TaxID=180344 RepID=A0A430ANB0_9ENTE|nr:MBL fold metallo-hydrolase [Vagococcus elongatus]RSU09463.1 hypothetical protein CBF29_11485 [Vagococcus elongatus]
MEITVLGFWGAYPWNKEGTSSYLLKSSGFSLLIDAGSGTFNMLRETIEPLELDAVIISHYHHDHIADLGVLQYYRQLNQPEGHAELPIYGHTEHEFYFDALTMPKVSKGIPYEERTPITIGPFTVGFLRTRHPVPCFAMRITETSTGKNFVYTADSGYLNKFTDFIEGTNLLIADSYFLNGNEDNPVHFTAKEVGEMAKNGGVPKVLLSHLQQEIHLSLLKSQAEEAAGTGVDVLLAETGLTIVL